jgi:hypothetical protein
MPGAPQRFGPVCFMPSISSRIIITVDTPSSRKANDCNVEKLSPKACKASKFLRSAITFGTIDQNIMSCFTDELDGNSSVEFPNLNSPIVKKVASPYFPGDCEPNCDRTMCGQTTKESLVIMNGTPRIDIEPTRHFHNGLSVQSARIRPSSAFDSGYREIPRLTNPRDLGEEGCTSPIARTSSLPSAKVLGQSPSGQLKSQGCKPVKTFPDRPPSSLQSTLRTSLPSISRGNPACATTARPPPPAPAADSGLMLNSGDSVVGAALSFPHLLPLQLDGMAWPPSR